jgi:hypothetical protein
MSLQNFLLLASSDWMAKLRRWLNSPYDIESFWDDDDAKRIAQYLPTSPINLYRGEIILETTGKNGLLTISKSFGVNSLTELVKGITGTVTFPRATSWSIDENSASRFTGRVDDEYLGIIYKVAAKPSDILAPLYNMRFYNSNSRFTHEGECILKGGTYTVEVAQREEANAMPLEVVKKLGDIQEALNIFLKDRDEGALSLYGTRLQQTLYYRGREFYFDITVNFYAPDFIITLVAGHGGVQINDHENDAHSTEEALSTLDRYYRHIITFIETYARAS